MMWIAPAKMVPMIETMIKQWPTIIDERMDLLEREVIFSYHQL